LKVFLAVVQHGSFNRAAKALLMSQPAVSQRIRQLEALLGVPLFQRTAQGVRLTPAGQRFLRYAQALHWLFLAAESHVSTPHPEDRRRLLLGATPTVSFYCLPEWLKHFHKTHSNVLVHLRTGTTSQLLQQVTKHILPLALVEGELPDQPRVNLIILRKMEFLVVAPAREPWVSQQRIPLEALDGVPFVTRPRDAQTRKWMEAIFARYGIRPRIVAELDSPEAIKHAVAQGLGLSMLPRCLAERTSRSDLHFLEIANARLTRHIKAIWAYGQPLAPLALSFLQSLESCFPHLRSVLAQYTQPLPTLPADGDRAVPRP